MKLEQIAPYLPYKLKIKRGERILVMNTGHGSSVHWIGISSVLKWFNSEMISKPRLILRPLSDLTKPILEGGKIPIVELLKLTYPNRPIEGKYSEITVEADGYPRAYYTYSANHVIMIYTNSLMYEKYWIVEKLFEWHFDVFGLIESGEAIYINTLSK